MPLSATQIRWPLSTAPGIRPQEDAGRLVNCYAEPYEDRAVYYRAAGVDTYAALTGPTTTGVFRGGILVGNILYCVFGTQLWNFVAGIFTLIGTVSGTDKVFFARNFAATPDIVLVCQAGAFVITVSSINPYPDLDVGSPTCVAGHLGFFIFGYGDGSMLSSDINSTNLNTLNAAVTTTNPDGIIEIVPYSGWVYVMGLTTVEIWGEPINGTGFPLTRSGYNFTPGLINAGAVAGQEAEFGQPPIYVGSDHSVRQINGYAPTDISTPQLRRQIHAVAQNADITAMVYVIDGTPFWQVNGLGVGAFSWVFNCANSNWHERTSYLLQYSRLTGSVFAFDVWLCGDTKANGRFLEISSSFAKEIDDPFIPVLESIPVDNFPINIACPRADFEFATGVGDAQGHDPDETNPYAEVSWSDDGGEVWKGPRLVPLGRQSKSLTKVTVWRTGLSGPQGRRWRLAVPSAIHLGFLGGNMTALPTGYP